MKSELAIKRDEWLYGEEGSKCCDSATLPPGEKGRRYQRNRLERAFLAGAIANEEVKKEFGDKVIDSLTL